MAKENYLSNPDNELAAKLVYLFLAHNGYEIQVPSYQVICDALGISRSRFYRARIMLIQADVLKFEKKYCESTGKVNQEIYKIIG